ncbi:DNA-binding transcriptional regulator, ArsR family [Robiginitalea myxolifaciens]|uniref:DNA-binding transcriptional regulator, ArsR family n=1 Tax=Robiginitalea myxolifaciens TaxID=400055 RepID=A0A1I6G821_9FLAO|nr:autorepressor SdpR family transcription factor [Robiginitalea myxolifaciens]SFR38335.1 DNA-binding transcriptional regulator, ArsR family [Robiginitalea myxolifaciens]
MNALFKALSDPTRRSILELLKQGRLSAGDIASHFDISRPSISHHLELLFQAGLVRRSKEGQYVYYELNTSIVEDLLHWVIQLKNEKP